MAHIHLRRVSTWKTAQTDVSDDGLIRYTGRSPGERSSSCQRYKCYIRPDLRLFVFISWSRDGCAWDRTRQSTFHPRFFRRLEVRDDFTSVCVFTYSNTHCRVRVIHITFGYMHINKNITNEHIHILKGQCLCKYFMQVCWTF